VPTAQSLLKNRVPSTAGIWPQAGRLGGMDLHPKKILCGSKLGLGAGLGNHRLVGLFMDISRTQKKTSIHNFMGYPILTHITDGIDSD